MISSEKENNIKVVNLLNENNQSNDNSHDYYCEKCCLGSIQRNSQLNISNVEYADYAINHVYGCSHGCLYCYAFSQQFKFKKVRSYEEWLKPKLVENCIDIIKNDLLTKKNKVKYVQLSFMTDPFMYGYNDVKEKTLEIIRLLNKENIRVVTLTKGILPLELAQLSKKNEYGITIVSLDENYREKYEPYTAKFEQRLQSLKILHDKGFNTWISMEPYPTPNMIEQNIYEVLQRISFVDKIIFGRINHFQYAMKYDKHKQFFNEQANIVINFCKQHNIECLIKSETITDTNKPVSKKSKISNQK